MGSEGEKGDPGLAMGKGVKGDPGLPGRLGLPGLPGHIGMLLSSYYLPCMVLVHNLFMNATESIIIIER